MSNSSDSSSTLSFLSMLTVLFIGLKLTGYITWSWLWVLAPTWIPLALALAALTVFGLLALFTQNR